MLIFSLRDAHLKQTSDIVSCWVFAVMDQLHSIKMRVVKGFFHTTLNPIVLAVLRVVDISHVDVRSVWPGVHRPQCNQLRAKGKPCSRSMLSIGGVNHIQILARKLFVIGIHI